jgi:hypothetical protein
MHSSSLSLSHSLSCSCTQACYICGESSHRSEHCPKKALEVYQLPSDIQTRVNAQYERDVALMGGSTAGMESEYKSFLRVRGSPFWGCMGCERKGAWSGRGRGGHRR